MRTVETRHTCMRDGRRRESERDDIIYKLYDIVFYFTDERGRVRVGGDAVTRRKGQGSERWEEGERSADG